MEDTAAEFARSFGHLDVLINTASIFPDSRVMSALDADLDYVCATRSRLT
jgi:NAD(P)-dependent dehydrogenase (short-subunit alcohol dehydrogenase family)